jgi:pimeloyl-ACP methyl ester carboxylesterase
MADRAACNVDVAQQSPPTTIALSDGRRLGIALYGDPCGTPIVYCHGFPASRLEAAFADDAARKLRARLIAFDRPGYGLSDFKAGRRIADWPRDVREATEALGVGRFAVLGISGGAPYALACGAHLADRVSAIGIVCGLGPTCAEDLQLFDPFARAMFGLARRVPWLSRAVVGLIASVLARHPQWIFSLLAAGLPPCDRQVIRDGRVRPALLASVREAFRQGARGTACDLALYAAHDDAAFAPMTAPAYVWHGECDSTVPIAMGRRLAAALDATAVFSSEHGHYSLPVCDIEAILRPLVSAR